ncbi:MAG: threonine synthase, partial [Flavisolibacter sp.]
MKYFSLNKQSPEVDFREATIRGQAPDKGLYFPEYIPKLPQNFSQEIEQ